MGGGLGLGLVGCFGFCCVLISAVFRSASLVVGIWKLECAVFNAPAKKISEETFGSIICP